jgi:myo-inositol 2-dehydrogenase/D-chiro-inositol 1-dehydrogenase
MEPISRRQVITGVTGGILIVAPETAFSYQANSTVSFGVIGTGGRGVYVGTHMANVKGTKIAAICDIYPDRIDNAKTKIPGAQGARVYKDYHELLAQPDVDAVLITTPVFLHPEHFEAAVPSGKHIYCEKPAGADVAGVKRLLRASDKAAKKQTIQFGFQQRFSPEYLTAMNYYKSGKVGDIKMMMSYWNLGGTPPKPAAAPIPPPTAEEKIRRWGSWMAQSGGVIVEQDCHGVDMLNWFANDAHPISARGRQPALPPGLWRPGFGSSRDHLLLSQRCGRLADQHQKHGRLPRCEGTVLRILGHAGDGANLLQAARSHRQFALQKCG